MPEFECGKCFSVNRREESSIMTNLQLMLIFLAPCLPTLLLYLGFPGPMLLISGCFLYCSQQVFQVLILPTQLSHLSSIVYFQKLVMLSPVIIIYTVLKYFKFCGQCKGNVDILGYSSTTFRKLLKLNTLALIYILVNVNFTKHGHNLSNNRVMSRLRCDEI